MYQNIPITSYFILYFMFFLLQNDGSSNQNEPELDDECAKVFAMDSDNNEKFNVDKLHDTAPVGEPKNYGEKEYSSKHFFFLII